MCDLFGTEYEDYIHAYSVVIARLTVLVHCNNHNNSHNVANCNSTQIGQCGAKQTSSASKIVSLNRLSVGCGTTPRRQFGYINGFCLGSSRDL